MEATYKLHECTYISFLLVDWSHDLNRLLRCHTAPSTGLPDGARLFPKQLYSSILLKDKMNYIT